MMSLASAYAAGSSSACGYVRRNNPLPAASLAGKTRPVATHSMACWMPTARGRYQLAQASGTMPRRAKTKPIFASSAASRMSIGSVIVMPTPTAGPLTAAMTTFRHALMRSTTAPPESRG